MVCERITHDIEERFPCFISTLLDLKKITPKQLIVTTFQAIFSKKYNPIIPPDQKAHQAVTRVEYEDFLTSTFGFPEAQIQQFCLLT